MKTIGLLCCIVLCALAAPTHAQMSPTKRTTSDGRPLASSLPPKATQQRSSLQPLAFEELSRHVGDQIRLVTIYGDSIEGRVEGVSGSTLQLRRRAGAGYAITNFERARIRSLTRL